MATFYSTAKAAPILKLSQRRVQQYIKNGTLKLGSDGLQKGITATSLFQLRRRIGLGQIRTGPVKGSKRKAKQ